MPLLGSDAYLVMRAGARAFALPLTQAIETMRPLAVEPLAGAPSFVLGIAVVRGAPMPVVDVAALVGASAEAHGRFVTVRAGSRAVALAVESVVGARTLRPDRIGDAPPLLRNAVAGAIDAVATLDADLLIVLRTAKLVPDDVWSAIPSILS